VSDIRTLFLDFTQGADLAIDGLLLAADDGLDTAVILSLFTDARADDDDTLPQGSTDHRGWWGDVFAAATGDRIGSRLWLLLPGKQTVANLNAAREFGEEALAWLVDDGIASRVVVEATNPRDSLLALAIAIERPPGKRLARRYEILWSA